ncbi:MAG TPA: hypothetical protein VK787_02335 [Puia sp.]|jgi:hypothetical protein|nr:hypothetical protein [Puia sp.]
MYSKEESLETLQDIKKMMERSSRFISLSGLSGVAAGICALMGAWVAHAKIEQYKSEIIPEKANKGIFDFSQLGLLQELIITAAITFIAAFVFAFVFTYLRSKKTGIPLWGLTAKRLLINTIIPMIVGGIVILRMMQLGDYELIGASCLVFYGLALVNASKYTFDEIRYLGYAELILGLISFWAVGNGLYFWAAGFGVMHIIYGIVMWWKYERVKS